MPFDSVRESVPWATANSEGEAGLSVGIVLASVCFWVLLDLLVATLLRLLESHIERTAAVR
jgi:hypothetical protein